MDCCIVSDVLMMLTALCTVLKVKIVELHNVDGTMKANLIQKLPISRSPKCQKLADC